MQIELNEQEAYVIKLLRQKDYQTITVKVKDGRIVHIKVEESIDLDKLGNGKNPSL